MQYMARRESHSMRQSGTTTASLYTFTINNNIFTINNKAARHPHVAE